MHKTSNHPGLSCRRTYTRPRLIRAATASLVLFVIGVFCACTSQDFGLPWQPSKSSGLAVTSGYQEELAAPSEPTIVAADISGARSCGGCHTAHYAEWQTSPHAHAMEDPIFRGLIAVQREHRGDSDADRFCVQCHSPIGVRSGDVQPGFDFDELSTVSNEAVSCEVCHRSSEVARPYNAGLVISQDGYLRGPISDPNAPHDARSNELFSSSLLCASCHDVVDGNGLTLESPYQEWLQSPARAEGLTCQSCHMPSYGGQAAPVLKDSAVREQLHRHTFLALAPVDSDTAACTQRGQLCAAAALRSELSSESSSRWELRVEVKSRVDGHNFPTGSAFFREAWLTVKVFSGDELIYQSGQLDDDGNLSDRRNTPDDDRDPGLVVFHEYLLDADGRPTLFPWRAASRQSHALAPRETKVATYRGSMRKGAALRAEVWLKFRKFSPKLLAEIGKPELAETLEVYDLQHVTAELHPE